MPLLEFLMNTINKLETNKSLMMLFMPNKVKNAQKSSISEMEKSKKPTTLLLKLTKQRTLVKAKNLETKKTPESQKDN